MVTLHRRDAWKIAVYGAEHGVRHFHIEGRTFRCSVAIGSWDVIVGTAPHRVLAEALEWAVENEDALTAKWEELNP